MPDPIPVLLCGKFPSHLKAVSDAVRPDFEVVKTASTLADAKSTSSELVKEGSVKCIVMGGGFSPDDFNEVRAIATEAGGVAWFRPAFTAPGSTVGKPGSPPSAEEVAESVRKALEAKKDLLNGGHGRDEVWYF